MPDKTEGIQKAPSSMKKKTLSMAIGAAFVSATTCVGPGFCTQTALFTEKFLGAFVLIVFLALLCDLVAQGNVYRLVSFRGQYAQDIANDLLPKLGYVLSFAVMFGIAVFQFGNVGGTALGLQCIFDWDINTALVVSGILAVLLFISKQANYWIDQAAKVLGGVLLIATLYIAVVSAPPVSQIPTQIFTSTADFSLLIFPLITTIGGSCGGYIPMIGPHRLLSGNITGKENYQIYKQTQFTAAGVAYTVRMLIFLCVFGVVSKGAVLDPANPAAAAFQAGAGMLGYRIFGLVLFTAGITTVVGAAVTFVSMIRSYHPWIADHERQLAILCIVFSTLVMIFIGQPAAMLVAAGTINGLILPLIMVVMLFVSRNKRMMGEDYRHPLVLTIGAIIVTIVMGYFGILNIPKIFALFQ